MEKIYHVYSIANNVSYNEKHYDNVSINWFIVERKKSPIPYELAISNYTELTDESKLLLEDYINEQFTQKEAELLKVHLAKRNNIVKIEEIELPIVDNRRGYNNIEISQGTGFYVLYKNEQYNLPFKVKGFFNVNLADESIKADNKATMISKIDKKTLEDLRKMTDETEDNEIKGDKTRLFIDSEE